MESTIEWIWSAEHGRHYRHVFNYQTNAYEVVWAAAAESSTTQAITPNTNHAVTSGTGDRRDSVGPDQNMVPPASANIRNQLRFHGTPDRGWYETLDPRYRMRTRGEANQFFKTGRVFAMLWAEAASETMVRRNGTTENSAITVGRFGQNVFSQIRRFVVVQVNREAHFVYALAISTYGGRGVTKPGCRASEHTIVHLNNGHQPVAFQEELDRGMTKEPIMVDATDPATEVMEVASRLRCGKVYSIEWNVKVRDIGMVTGRHKTRLMRYFREEQTQGFDPDTEEEEEGQDDYQQPTNPHSYTRQAHYGYPPNPWGH